MSLFSRRSQGNPYVTPAPTARQVRQAEKVQAQADAKAERDKAAFRVRRSRGAKRADRQAQAWEKRDRDRFGG